MHALSFGAEEVFEDGLGDGLGGAAGWVMVDENAWFGVDFNGDGVVLRWFFRILNEHVNAGKCYSYGLSGFDGKPQDCGMDLMVFQGFR